TVWADTANECALFFEQVAVEHFLGQTDKPTDWTCAGKKFQINWGEGITGLDDYEGGNYKYEIEIDDGSSEYNPKDPCFKFEVESVQNLSQAKNVTIKSSGFNICDKQNIRAVERSYRINYNGEYAPSY
ncbi:MAG TPA: hypothetical protein PKK32_00885, partial [Candidatus Paceibacterota bacterium]|nr:hypothetical protein [Candidatus Paceibacterota bacterium]